MPVAAADVGRCLVWVKGRAGGAVLKAEPPAGRRAGVERSGGGCSDPKTLNPKTLKHCHCAKASPACDRLIAVNHGRGGQVGKGSWEHTWGNVHAGSAGRRFCDSAAD
jgi:hypothetical protein